MRYWKNLLTTIRFPFRSLSEQETILSPQASRLESNLWAFTWQSMYFPTLSLWFHTGVVLHGMIEWIYFYSTICSQKRNEKKETHGRCGFFQKSCAKDIKNLSTWRNHVKRLYRGCLRGEEVYCLKLKIWPERAKKIHGP